MINDTTLAAIPFYFSKSFSGIEHYIFFDFGGGTADCVMISLD